MSSAFPWNYHHGDGASPAHYYHTILARPGFEESLMPTQQSDWLNIANKVLLEIFMANDIKIKSVLRINVNCTHETDGKTTPCLLYTSPSPRDRQKSRMPSSA